MDFQRKTYIFLRVASDIVVLYFTLVINWWIFSGEQNKNINHLFLIVSTALILIWMISARETKVYDEFQIRNIKFEIISILNQSVIQFISLMALLFLLGINSHNKFVVISYGISLFTLVTAERFVFRKILERMRKKGRNLRSILFVGGDNITLDLYDKILKNSDLGYFVTGFLNDSPVPSLNGKYLGTVAELEKILASEKVDNVLINLQQFTDTKVNELIRISEKFPTRVRLIKGYKSYTANNDALPIFDRFEIETVRRDYLYSTHWRLVKRIFDLFFSAFVIVTVYPLLFPVIAVVIKLTSKGPVFFKQERWGRGNKKFKVIKFRTMKYDDNTEFAQATKNDPRVTKFGRFLRKTNLDELPQFINVLKGEMSVVGPRPHPTPLNVLAKNKINNYMLRHLVKPGITGWAQIHGFRGETKNENLMRKRVEYDLWYIENWSLWLDIKIILITIIKTLTGDPNAY